MTYIYRSDRGVEHQAKLTLNPDNGELVLTHFAPHPTGKGDPVFRETLTQKLGNPRHELGLMAEWFLYQFSAEEADRVLPVAENWFCYLRRHLDVAAANTYRASLA